MFGRIAFRSLILAALAAGSPAWASNCAMRDTVIERLQSDYDEQLAVGGLQATRSALTVMEIWASDETGTFTVLLTDANGVSCIVAAGTDFFRNKPVPRKKGSAS